MKYSNQKHWISNSERHHWRNEHNPWIKVNNYWIDTHLFRSKISIQIWLVKMPVVHGEPWKCWGLGAGDDCVSVHGRATKKICQHLSALLGWALEGTGWPWCRSARPRQALLPFGGLCHLPWWQHWLQHSLSCLSFTICKLKLIAATTGIV